MTIDVEVDIQTGETYMLFESYVCVMESQGLNKRNKHQMQETYGYGSCGETRRNTYMWGKSHSNINANGKTNQETNQEPHEPIPMHGDGAEEAERCRGTMPALEILWETVHSASVKAWKVTEHNMA